MTESGPFTDLPAALVQEVLNITQEIGNTLLTSFDDLDDKREERRTQLVNSRLLGHESDLEYLTPTCCGVDGSFGVERLLALDLTAAAAVAMEGLTPPSETRYWAEPYHLVHVGIEPHSAETGSILRAIMMGMELTLARQAPHDVVLLDGSFTTPVIFFNQALSKIGDIEDEGVRNLDVSIKLLDFIKGFLEEYQTILEARRSDKCWVAVPKYTTRREIGALLGWPENYDDRAMLTDLLQPGEFTKPIQLQAPKQPWHISTNAIKQEDSNDVDKLVTSITGKLTEVRALYYRPNRNLPALRLEMSRGVAETPGRLASVISAIKHQCSSAAILEPFPLYMADRMVKKLSSSIPTFRQVLTQSVAEHYQGNISNIFLNLHGYRTE